MTTNHPAHGPVSLDRLHQISEILSKASAQSDGGNIGYAMADAVKVINGAIAAFSAEPVAWLHSDNGIGIPAITRSRNVADSWFSKGWNIKPLYTTPPAPVVPPEQHWEELCRQHPDMSIGDAIIRAAWWNHCRAAMLQAGNHTEQHLDMVDHSGDDNEKVDCRLPFDQWLSQQNEPIDVDCGCVTTEAFYHWLRVAYEAGNSPVTQDGSERFANSVERFGKFSAEFGEGGEIELSITLFHFGNGNIHEDKRKSTTPKFMFQGVINQLQKKCDEMTDEPLINLTELWFGDESKG